MIFAIASENKPKVRACKAVIQRIHRDLNDNTVPEFICHNTSSGVPDMPLSQSEMMSGARNRAIRLHDRFSVEGRSIAYTIGLEGGFHQISTNPMDEQVCFLQSWVYVFDGENGYWGSSGSVPVPGRVYHSVIDEKRELAEVIDQFSGKNDVRSRMGAVGIFTNGMINRQDLFENALEFAFAPFYNPKVYQAQWKSIKK